MMKYLKKSFGLFVWVASPLAAYFLGQLAAGLLMVALKNVLFDRVVYEFVYMLIAYTVMTVAVVFGVWVGVYKRHKTHELLGFAKKLLDYLGSIPNIIWWTLSYFAIMMAVSLFFTLLLPEMMAGEQYLGVPRAGNSWWQMALIFVSFVIFPSIAEETAFRGAMFGGLRRRLPFWVSTIIISLLFALVHSPINVMVDVFILSIFLCLAREKTGSIWAPMTIHLLKNLAGFLAVFVFA
jgi:membrane protease YdiL (CAAX protease family)